jgi:tRNA (guanine37-N1)-methyltransferase
MRAPALIVPRSRGEAVRRTLVEGGLLRLDLEILHEGERLAFPLVSRAEAPAEAGEIAEREFRETARGGPADYRELLSGTPEEKERLPRSFDVVGEIVLIRVPDDVADRGPEIGEALLRFVPGARLVGADHGVHGKERRRRLERLAGSGGWRTRHRENHVELDVDLERAYFSPRLAREHARVASDVRAGEVVYDLCCGVGPFSVLIARDGRAGRIVAVDSNPDAIDLLRATLDRYGLATRVEAVEMDIERFLADRPPADRVVLNLPHEGIKYLPSVARAVAGPGRLHFYEVVPRAELEHRAEAVVETLGNGTSWSVVEWHVVHPYSPASDLVAMTLARATE